jgi:hypothetical protein
MQIDLSELIMPQRLKLSINVCRDLDLEYLNFKACIDHKHIKTLASQFGVFLSQSVGNY